jgi:hypothetical protein
MSEKKFDRSAFAATKVSALKTQEAEVKDLTGNKGSRVEYLKLKKGKNKIRIFPSHPDSPSFCFARTIHFLELEKTDKDGAVIKDDNGKVTYGRRPIFNSKVHGEFAKGVKPADIIDEYISRVYIQSRELVKDDDRRKKYLSTMTFWKTGITSKTKWVVYANVYDDNGIPEFGRLELPTTVKDKLNEISSNQEGDGMIEVDPFTDPDDGRVVFITYNPDEEDAKKKYTAAIDFQKVTPLTDDELRKFSEQKSLEKMFKNSYSNKDFMNALEGLKRFDTQSVFALRGMGFESGYNIFAQEDFLDVCETMSELFPEKFEEAGQSNSFVDGDQTANSDGGSVTTDNSTPFEETPQSLEMMTIDQLSQYIHDNDLDVTILPEDVTEDIVQAIRDEQPGEMAEVAEVAPERTSRRSNRSADLD